jgi:hypothetical protein
MRTYKEPLRHTTNFSKHTLEKAAAEQGKKYPARQCIVCPAHTKCDEIRYICKLFCSALQRLCEALSDTLQAVCSILG